MSTVSTGSRVCISQILLFVLVSILFVAFLPYVSSSPTPSINPIEGENNENKLNYDSSALIFDPPNTYQALAKEDSSFVPSSVHDRPSLSSSYWYAQPRANANQFLMSSVHDNGIIVPKWYTRSNSDDDDDVDDYAPAGLLVNKRSSLYHNGGYPQMKKRKQNKPPMEVMNEIVNSIYLKR